MLSIAPLKYPRQFLAVCFVPKSGIEKLFNIIFLSLCGFQGHAYSLVTYHSLLD